MEGEDFSLEVLFTKLFNIGFKLWRTSVVFFPVTLRRNSPFTFATSRLSFLYEVFSADVLLASLKISNPVDETELTVNVVRSKS